MDVVMGTGGRETKKERGRERVWRTERERGQGRQENVKSSSNVRQESREKKESFFQPTNTHWRKSKHQSIGSTLVIKRRKLMTKLILKL